MHSANEGQMVKQKLFEKALELFGDISPAGGDDFEQCYNENFGELVFWFNTQDNSTHIVRERDLN
jgi:hypothetical protein